MRISRAAPLATLLLLGIGAASARESPGPHPVLTAVSDGRPLSIDDPKGRYLAVHFMGPLSTPAATAFVRDYLLNSPTVAGVTHAFVAAEPIDQVKAWAAQFGDDAALIFVDKDAALARDLELGTGPTASDAPAATPATVVLDPDGKEIFRVPGASPDAYPPFARFAGAMADKSRPPALADYNLPKDKPVAVNGYDVVAYFTRAGALPGRPEFASAYRGITYRFATADNRRLFAADPEKYLPTYGGWCATAMGDKGTKVEIDPTSFKVKDGRLFLFYKGLFGNALKDWNKHESDWEPAADANWKKLTREDPIKPPR